MNVQFSNLGVFGKLPAHGDFVERNMPKEFSRPWDEWLQRCIAHSREDGGENWLNYYLTAPVWHFALGQGAIDANPWVGAVIPSVDSVGRYFPFTFVKKLGSHQDPFACLARNLNHFEDLATLVIDALQQNLPVEHLWETLFAESTVCLQNSDFTSRFAAQKNINFIQQDASNLSDALVGLSYSHTRLSSTSSSLWHCSASAETPATTFTLAGLPDPELFWSMLSNQWRF